MTHKKIKLKKLKGKKKNIHNFLQNIQIAVENYPI